MNHGLSLTAASEAAAGGCGPGCARGYHIDPTRTPLTDREAEYPDWRSPQTEEGKALLLEMGWLPLEDNGTIRAIEAAAATAERERIAAALPDALGMIDLRSWVDRIDHAEDPDDERRKMAAALRVMLVC